MSGKTFERKDGGILSFSEHFEKRWKDAVRNAGNPDSMTFVGPPSPDQYPDLFACGHCGGDIFILHSTGKVECATCYYMALNLQIKRIETGEID